MSELEYLKHASTLCPTSIVSMDWICEPNAIRKTGLSISKHVEKTVTSLGTILNLIEHSPKIRPIRFASGSYFDVIGVIQGWSIEDYLCCIDMLRDQGLILPHMAVGSLCRPNSEKQVIRILRAIKRELPDVKLHGLGVKTSVLKYPEAREILYSVDSAAWGHDCYALSGRDAKAPCLKNWYNKISNLAQQDHNQTKLLL
jgi:hypothetical protein